ncbi:MAG: autotransporter outer membrane beta-barrel domain-containing protein [Chlamydiota bacterium]
MFFAVRSLSGATFTWNLDVDGVWALGTNWTPTGIPGQVTVDTVNLDDRMGITSPIDITLQDNALQPFSPMLDEIRFNATNTPFIISPFDLSKISLNDRVTVAPLNDPAAAHVLNVPITFDRILDLDLEDSARLYLGPLASLTDDDFFFSEVRINKKNSSEAGTGRLINETTLNPFDVLVFSATLENKAAVTPGETLLIGPFVEGNPTFINSGLNAVAGGQLGNFRMEIFEATVINSGTGAILGHLGGNSLMSVRNSTVINSGSNAFFGPSGLSGELIIQGTTVTNNGPGAFCGLKGPTGILDIRGSTIENIGNVTLGIMEGRGTVITRGSIRNLEGALISAGPEGLFHIAGGSIVNDALSTLGSVAENVSFTGGTVVSEGNLFAFNYTQEENATLQLNLSSFPSVYGKVSAKAVGSINGTLIIDAANTTIPSSVVIDLITAEKGLNGTYHTIELINFPSTIIPTLNQTETALQLFTAQVITPALIGPVPFISFISTVEINSRVGKSQYFIHRRLLSQQYSGEDKVAFLFPHSKELLATSAPLAELNQPQVQRKQDQLAQRLSKDGCSAAPTRAYIGPVGNIGDVSALTDLQLGFDYHSYGFFTGIDHTFDHWGVGSSFDYRAITGDANSNPASFKIHQVHGTLYAVWVAPHLPGLALNSLVGVGYDSYNIRRRAGPDSAQVEAVGRPNGIKADALVGIDYIFSRSRFRNMPANFTATPFVNLQFDWLKVSAFKETGGSIYVLRAEGQHISSLQSALGIRLDYLVHTRSVCLQPQLSLAWQCEYLNLNHTIHLATTHLSRPTKETLGVIAPGRHTLVLGIDFLVIAFKCFEVETSYDLQWNNSYKNHSIYVGIGGYF